MRAQVFAREGALWAVAFDAERLEVQGEAVPIVENVFVNPAGYASYDVAVNGSLAYIPAGSGGPTTVVWVDRQRREESVPGLTPGQYRDVQVSPDGTRLAVTLDTDIWVYDVQRGVANPLTTDSAGNTLGSGRWRVTGFSSRRETVRSCDAAPTGPVPSSPFWRRRLDAGFFRGPGRRRAKGSCSAMSPGEASISPCSQ